MIKRLWLPAILLTAVACAVLVILNVRTNKRLSSATADLAHSRKTISDLEEQLQNAESERDSASQKMRELQQELASLMKQRKEDGLVIEALWRGLRPDVRGTGKVVRFDAEAIRKLLTSSEGDLETLIGQILTAEGIAATLKEHSEDPIYWVAAASLMQDKDEALKYLQEAVRIHPESAVVLSALVEALIAKGQFDETTMGHIAQLKQVDPANSLPDYYDARCRFEAGDIQGALQSLAEASLKDRFADNRMDLLMAQYDYFLNGGCSDSIAKGLAAFTLPLNHMAILRDAGRDAMEQARASIAAGQYEEALRIADSVSRTGSNLSSSGRFLIYDLVGMALQKMALNEQRRIYEAWGNAFQIEQIDSQLASLEDRLSLMKAMASSFGADFQNMTEEDIAKYVDGVIRNGEFSTLRDLPGVADAVRRAREQEQ
jgi:tetratricopeptide (TPR) repeat protein